MWKKQEGEKPLAWAGQKGDSARPGPRRRPSTSLALRATLARRSASALVLIPAFSRSPTTFPDLRPPGHLSRIDSCACVASGHAVSPSAHHPPVPPTAWSNHPHVRLVTNLHTWFRHPTRPRDPCHPGPRVPHCGWCLAPHHAETVANISLQVPPNAAHGGHWFFAAHQKSTRR